MKTKILALLLLAGSCAFAGPRIAVGIGIGGGYYPYAGYVAPPPVVYAPPPVVYPYARPYVVRPYAGRVWVGPRYFGGRYYRGYWRR